MVACFPRYHIGILWPIKTLLFSLLCLMFKQMGRRTYSQTSRQIDRQGDRQTDRQTDRIRKRLIYNLKTVSFVYYEIR